MSAKKNIIYICDAEKKASGGAKIIYQHSAIINSLKNLNSEVLHIKLKKRAKWGMSISKKISFLNYSQQGWQANQIKAVENFKHTWFKNKINLKIDLKFDSRKDFVIIPEIYAHLADDLLIKKKIKYAIFVQNGYAINSTSNSQKIEKVYNNAQCILSYSKDITDCILINFPKLKKKIIQLSISVNVQKYKFKQKKKNLITFMSRKLPHHSSKVVSILKRHLPLKWKIKDLNNITEKEVFNNLHQSKIFLSFSELEGLGIPPIEAALLKNYVIGYIGEGGKDYWSKPLFTKISCGDINQFVYEILKKAKTKNLGNYNLAKYQKKLKEKYSIQNEVKSLKIFLKKIRIDF